MISKLALIGAATLFSASLALAQSNSSPDSTAGGAAGTSKQNPQRQLQQQNPAQKGTMGAGQRRDSSPEGSAGGAVGTSKDPSKKN
jgi:hypothetical protein